MGVLLRPDEPFRRYLPAAAISAVGLLFALGSTTDIPSILVASVLVPVVAAALNLLAPTFVAALANPQAVTISLANRGVLAVSQDADLKWRERRAVRRALLDRARPIVADEITEFWKQRDTAPDIFRRIERREVSIVSLLVIACTYLSASLLPFMRLLQDAAYGYYYSYSYGPGEAILFIGLFIVGMIFASAYSHERDAYRRQIQDHIPLLMASGEYLDSKYWEGYYDYVVERRQFLGATLAGEKAKSAEERLELAKSGDFEKAWVEKGVADIPGVKPANVDGLLGAAIRVRREYEDRVRWLSIVSLILVFGLLVAWATVFSLGLGDLRYLIASIVLLVAVVVVVIVRGYWMSSEIARIRELRNEIAHYASEGTSQPKP